MTGPAPAHGQVELDEATLRERLAAQPWTDHNLELVPGVRTVPGRYDFLTADGRLAAIRRTLRLLLGDDLTGRRVADLGSLEGGFAVAMAQLGAEVLAVEARAANVEKVRLAADALGGGRVTVAHADVKDVDLERHGRFDVTLALGILYHLDDPVRWLAQIGECTSRVLIVDTHTAPVDDLAMARLRPDLRHLGQLEVAVVGGIAYEGRWFSEYAPSLSTEAIEDQLWASWSNPRSFWLTEASLLQALVRAGFEVVYRQHEHAVDVYRTFAEEYPRGVYVACRLPAGDDR